MENITAIDSNGSVTLNDTGFLDSLSFSHLTGAHCTETTAIDVAIGSATLTFSSYSTAVDNDIGIAIHTGQLTTAIDRLQNSSRMAFYIVTNRYLWIACNCCRQTETTAKDIFCDCTIDNVYCRIILALTRGIGSLVTTAIDTMVNSTAIDIDRYCILWSTQYIVTAKYVVNNSIGRATLFQCHSDRTIDVCCVISLCSFVIFTEATTVNVTFTTWSLCILYSTAIEVYLSGWRTITN